MSERIDHIEALDKALAGEEVDPSLLPLMEVAAETKALLAVRVPAEVAAEHIRGFHIPGVSAQPRATRSGARRSLRLQALLAAAIVILLTLGGSITASASALPGDALYPVKRAVENVNLAVERDASGRASLHLTYAERRLDELSTLLAARRAGDNVDVGAAMKAYREQVAGAEKDLRASGASDEFLERLEARLARHVDKLNALAADKKNPRAAEAIRGAIQNAQDAAARLAEKRANRPDKGNSKPERGKSSQAPGRQ